MGVIGYSHLSALRQYVLGKEGTFKLADILPFLPLAWLGYPFNYHHHHHLHRWLAQYHTMPLKVLQFAIWDAISYS